MQTGYVRRILPGNERAFAWAAHVAVNTFNDVGNEY